MSTPTLKTTNIKGKPYIEVKERVAYLAETYEGYYSIETQYTYFPDRKMWVVKAMVTITNADGGIINKYTGHAQEIESDDYRQVNHTSALENAETSAVGRAIAMMGVGIINSSFASADEVNKAQNRGSMVNTNGADAFSKESGNNTASTDELPWLKDKQLEAVIARIQAGDKSIYQKTLAAFKVNKEMRAKLAEAMNG
jgi:hypothetical protein